MYINRTLKEYLDDLAAKRPAPGGGSASACVASLGVSLMLMVLNFTAGNPKYKTSEERVSEALRKLEAAKASLERLLDKDVEAYNNVAKAIKESSKSSQALDDIYKAAADVPMEICTLSARCLEMCKELVEYGNKNLVTDTAIAALFLESAFFSAKYNVYINLKYINDMNYCEKVHNILTPLETEAPRLKEEILEKCEDVISK